MDIEALIYAVNKKVKVQEVLNHLVERVKDGDCFTSIGREIGNIEDANGNQYTAVITLTSDEDEVNLELPLINDVIGDGVCVVSDPKDVFEGVYA